MNNYNHSIDIIPAYDKASEGYGIHGADMVFTCKKDKKGITFTIFTGWHLPHIDKSTWPRSILGPTAADISYHDSSPHYEGHTCREICKVTEGKCYADGSGLLAEEFFQCLVREGYEGLKKKMEDLYDEWINRERIPA